MPAEWINAVMRMESGGRTMLTENMRMVSDKGAMGLMQILPGTYQEMAAQYRLGPDPFNTSDNIYAGAAYLHWLSGKYAYPAMFAAYNAGPQRVDDMLAKGTPLPAETRTYVSAIGAIPRMTTPGPPRMRFATLTRPDGTPVLIDPLAVRSIRAVFPGEYADGVQAVINMGALKQGVREDMAERPPALRHSAAMAARFGAFVPSFDRLRMKKWIIARTQDEAGSATKYARRPARFSDAPCRRDCWAGTGRPGGSWCREGQRHRKLMPTPITQTRAKKCRMPNPPWRDCGRYRPHSRPNFCTASSSERSFSI